MSLLGYQRVPKTTLKTNHLTLTLEDGSTKDLGPCTLEDLRLLEYVTQEAAGRLVGRIGRGGPSQATLSRVRAFARRMHSGAQ